MDVYGDGRQLSQCVRQRTAHTYTTPSTSLLLNSSEMHAAQKAVWKITSECEQHKRGDGLALSWHMVVYQCLSQQIQCQTFAICLFLEGLCSERLVQNSACKSLPQLRKKVPNFSPQKKPMHIKQEKLLLSLLTAESHHAELSDHSKALWIHMNNNSRYSKIRTPRPADSPLLSSHGLCLWCAIDRFIN